MKPATRDLGTRLPQRVNVPRVEIPRGRVIDLPGRGSTFVTDSPGPTPDAPPLLLLHALSTTGLLTWFPSIPELTKRFRVITLDQRLHGQGIVPEEFTLRDCADDAVALLDVLGIDKAMVAGYSMGSLIAQRVWRQHPDRVGGLVLAASTDAFQSTITERLFHQGVGASLGALRNLKRRRADGDTTTDQEPVDPTVDIHRWALAEFRSTRPWAVGQAVVAIGRHHSRPWIREIDVPTAVIVPKKDRAIPPERQIAMAHRIPGATLHQVDAGHSCCVMDAELFVPVMVEACATVLARWNEKEAAAQS
ncbi:alpha/beta fold hydrolase [Gordonia shandongensis]|uniref:alpha/beta fold hydrolase n=1 Tax=Gordonia shandongensis TaxID=376351 RepID=UPI0004279C7D|nr:alpha/beta fold hydrolase [Gordonia shandongensis]